MLETTWAFVYFIILLQQFFSALSVYTELWIFKIFLISGLQDRQMSDYTHNKAL